MYVLFLIIRTSFADENCTANAHVHDYCGTPDAGVCGPDDTCYCALGYWHDDSIYDESYGYCIEKPTDLGQISAFCGLCILLMMGKLMRIYVKPLQFLFFPSCVIGGFIGFIFLQICKSSSNSFNRYLATEWTNGWRELPSFLINLVFASLFLGVEIPSLPKVWEQAGPQLMYGMVVSWGQWAVALIFTAIFCVPILGSNELIGTTIPVGFAGGHGTAAGLSSSYKTLGYESGGDTALATATIGLLSSVLLGMALVNIAAKYGWVKESKLQSENTTLSLKGLHEREDRPVAGFLTTTRDSIDALALHLAIIGLAVLIGYCLKQILLEIESTSSYLTDHAFFKGFPLFPLCMIGGIVIQNILQKFNSEVPIVDVNLMDRVSGTSLDFLIVAGIATVDMSALGDDIVAILLLCTVALMWQVFCALVLARILNYGWGFENGICVFGQSTGVIAAGLMLLRMCDPESRTPVPRAFSYKQLIHSVFMGGGIWTSLALPLTNSLGLYPMIAICLSVMGIWLLVWAFYFRPKYPAMLAAYQQSRRRSIALGKEDDILKTPDIGLFTVDYKGDDNDWMNPDDLNDNMESSLLGGTTISMQETVTDKTS